MDDHKHHISEEVCETVKDGLKKAKVIAQEVFGDQCRSREVFGVYAHLIDTIHCEHKEKEAWE
jgi:hypothetical protein